MDSSFRTTFRTLAPAFTSDSDSRAGGSISYVDVVQQGSHDRRFGHLNLSCQFTSTVMAAGTASAGEQLARNRVPSGDTS